MDWEKTNGEQTEVDENARQQPNAEGEVTELDEEPGEELETAAEREAREKREEAERREKEKKRRLIPAFVTLLAAAIVSITMRILHDVDCFGVCARWILFCRTDFTDHA